MSKTQQTFALILACGFAMGCATHARDIARGGLFPYHGVPLPINTFWTALCPLDFAAAILALLRPRTATALGLLILLADVGVNSWIAYFSGLHVDSFAPLQVQSLFLGFVLGGSLFVFRRDEALRE